MRIAGLGPTRYDGLGVSPRYFLIVDEAGITGAQSNLATVFMRLAAAQRAAGRPNAVNELSVCECRPAPTSTASKPRSAGGSRAALPGQTLTISRAGAEPGTRQIFRDAHNDQKIYTVFAILVLAGAALAAFNLVSRAVEAQRREIGIGMALGAEPPLLARTAAAARCPRSASSGRCSASRSGSALRR